MNEKKNTQAEIQSWATLSRSVLNGVVGDYLVRENNPLAIEMAFYHQDQALVLDETLAQQMKTQSTKGLSNKIIILVHGLTNLETVWDLRSETNLDINSEANNESKDDIGDNLSDSLSDNYGLRIQDSYGFTPFYLRYNTGLSIQENSQQLNTLLNELVQAYPIKMEEVVLMGFSMGGLLIRSAQKIAQDDLSQSKDGSWIEKLSNCYYIGTPHEGSPLEKFGHLASSIVRLVPREYISHWADWIDMRSEGIQDLKHGLLHLNNSELENESDQDDPYEQSSRCGSFYVNAQHHFISGALSANKDSLINKFFGDSLVRHSSANPISAPEDCKTAHFDGIPHIPLAHSNRVYQQIKQWFDEHKTSVELLYAPSVNVSEKPSSKPQNLSNQDIISGTIDLLVTAYDHTVEAVETMHHSIADEPYNILKKIPIVKDVTNPISTTHKEILDVIYFSLKEGGKLAHKGAKLIRRK